MAERRAAAVRSTLLRATQLASLADLGPVLLPLGSAPCRLSVWGLKISLWGPKIGAASGSRGMFRSNESTATAGEAQVYCL
jgi:hypothetical protein